MSLITGGSYSHTYFGSSDVNFFLDDDRALTVRIDTERLWLRSVQATEEDYGDYVSLYGDPEVMSKFATGDTKPRASVEARINDTWARRWRENDPYSSLAVFKNDSDEFLGHVVIGHGDAPGESELAYLFMKKHWGNGFGTEAVTAVVKEYAPATVKEGYTLEGKALEVIMATARPDNPYSVKILEKLGMDKTGEEEKHGALRHHFAIDLSELT